MTSFLKSFQRRRITRIVKDNQNSQGQKNLRILIKEIKILISRRIVDGNLLKVTNDPFDWRVLSPGQKLCLAWLALNAKHNVFIIVRHTNDSLQQQHQQQATNAEKKSYIYIKVKKKIKVMTRAVDSHNISFLLCDTRLRRRP